MKEEKKKKDLSLRQIGFVAQNTLYTTIQNIAADDDNRSMNKSLVNQVIGFL